MIAADEKTGVCIRVLDTPLLSFGNPGIYLYNPEYEETEYLSLYINLFNNMWGTNFPQWIGGDMEYRFEISCLERNDADEKQWMELLSDPEYMKEICRWNEQDAGGVQFPAGMKLIGARKCGNGFCLYFSEIWGKNKARTFAAKNYRICCRDLMGRFGKFCEDKIVFEAAAYGMFISGKRVIEKQSSAKRRLLFWCAPASARSNG